MPVRWPVNGTRAEFACTLRHLRWAFGKTACLSLLAFPIVTRTLHVEEKAMATGFFMDSDGNTRRTDAPDEIIECQVIERGHMAVDVLDAQDFVMHEATLFPTLEAIAVAGVVVNLIGLGKYEH